MFVEISKGHIINTDKIISLSDETKQVKKKVVSYFDNTYSYEYTTSEVFEVFLAEGFKYEISKEAYNKLICNDRCQEVNWVTTNFLVVCF